MSAWYILSAHSNSIGIEKIGLLIYQTLKHSFVNVKGIVLEFSKGDLTAQTTCIYLELSLLKQKAFFKNTRLYSEGNERHQGF